MFFKLLDMFGRKERNENEWRAYHIGERNEKKERDLFSCDA